MTFCRANNLKTVPEMPWFPPKLRLFESISRDILSFEPLQSSTAISNRQHQECSALENVPFQELDPRVYQALLHRLNSEPLLSDHTFYRSVGEDTATLTTALSPYAQTLTNTVYLARRFTVFRHSKGDSQVMFRSHGSALPRSYGQIQNIFSHQRRLNCGEIRRQTFLTVAQYHTLSFGEANRDPYMQFDGLGARLVYSTPSTDIQVVPIETVISHIITCPFEDEFFTRNGHGCSVVLELDEVSFRILSMFIFTSDTSAQGMELTAYNPSMDKRYRNEI